MPSYLRLLISAATAAADLVSGESSPMIRAVATQTTHTQRDGRLRAAAVLVVSALLLAGAIVAAAQFGIGVRTTYGKGIDSSLGNQVQRDFLADQEAEAAAISQGDASPLTNHFSDSALGDLVQEISNNSASGPPPTISYQASSLTILKAQDPADPSLVIEVQEDGTETVTTSNGPNSAPTQQTIGFHGDYWLRLLSSRYAIADQNIQTQPSSLLPGLAVVAAALVWVGAAALLWRRQRGLPVALGSAPVTVGPQVMAPELHPVPEEEEPIVEPPGPPADVVIRTFGGLQVYKDGKDWADALIGRPITGFVWLRLLVAVIRDPSARLTREEIARQVTPGLDREVQLRRLRNVIYQGMRDLPPALRDRIVVEPQVLRFNLEGSELDAANLVAISAECAGRSMLTTAQAARAQRVLDASVGIFLPEFETVEDLATDHHASCTDLIRDLREVLASKRLELAMALADSYLARRNPNRAIAVLERARQEQPDRGDLTARLASAYRSAGRDPEAQALERRQA